jgi:hypothetical protein
LYAKYHAAGAQLASRSFFFQASGLFSDLQKGTEDRTRRVAIVPRMSVELNFGRWEVLLVGGRLQFLLSFSNLLEENEVLSFVTTLFL